MYLGPGLTLNEAVSLTGDMALVKANPKLVAVVPRGSYLELLAGQSFDGTAYNLYNKISVTPPEPLTPEVAIASRDAANWTSTLYLGMMSRASTGTALSAAQWGELQRATQASGDEDQDDPNLAEYPDTLFIDGCVGREENDNFNLRSCFARYWSDENRRYMADKSYAISQTSSLARTRELHTRHFHANLTDVIDFSPAQTITKSTCGQASVSVSGYGVGASYAMDACPEKLDPWLDFASEPTFIFRTNWVGERAG